MKIKYEAGVTEFAIAERLREEKLLAERGMLGFSDKDHDDIMRRFREAGSVIENEVKKLKELENGISKQGDTSREPRKRSRTTLDRIREAGL